MRTVYSIKNSLTSFISNIITFVFLFISQTIFIKLLGIEYIGLNGLFANVLTFLNLFELGIGSVITYNLYKYTKVDDEESIKSIMHFYKKAYNYVSAIVFIVGLLFIPFLKYIVHDITIDINIYIVYILFLISTVATYFISYKRNLLNAYQKNYISNLIHIMCVILVNVLQILIIYITKNYYLYLVIRILCILFENILITYKVNKDYPYILDKNIKPLDKKERQNIIDRVKALFIHKISNAIINGTDNIIISTFFGLKTLGMYINYYYITNTIYKLFLNIILSINSSVGNLLVEFNYEKNFVTFKKIKLLVLWFGVFTCVCLLLLVEPFITLWIGKEYLLDGSVLIIICASYFQRVMRNSYSVFKDGAGIWIEDKYVPIIEAILNIVFSIVLLKIYGLAGVFLGTIISSLVLWFYSYPKFVYKKLFNRGLKEYMGNLFKTIFIFVFIIFVCYILNMHNNNIFITILICLFIPNLILFIMYRKTKEFVFYKDLIKKIVKNRSLI